MANTTADKLAKLNTTKEELKAALAEKGQTVGEVFSAYPDAVRAIDVGGVEWKEITISPVASGKYCDFSCTIDVPIDKELIIYAGYSNQSVLGLLEKGNDQGVCAVVVGNYELGINKFTRSMNSVSLIFRSVGSSAIDLTVKYAIF